MKNMELLSGLDSRLGEIEYSVLSGRCGRNAAGLDLNNRAYAYWKEFWGSIYESAGSRAAFVLDDFSRQDVVGVLSRRDEIVAVHCHSFFNIEQRATLDHRYFLFYPPSYLERLREWGVRKVVTYEFLTLNPDWTKRKIGFPLAEAIMGLGLRVLEESDADAIISSVRRDVKVHEMCQRWGWETFQANVQRRNFPLDLMACHRSAIKPHVDPQIDEFCRQLWRGRGVDAPAPSILSKAA